MSPLPNELSLIVSFFRCKSGVNERFYKMECTVIKSGAWKCRSGESGVADGCKICMWREGEGVGEGEPELG